MTKQLNILDKDASLSLDIKEREDLVNLQKKITVAKKSDFLIGWIIALSIFVFVVGGLILLFAFIASQYNINDIDVNAKYFDNKLNFALSDIVPYLNMIGFIFFLTFIFAIFTKVSVHKRYACLADLEYYYINKGQKENLNDTNKARFDKVEKNLKYYKEVNKSYISNLFFTGLTFFFSVLVSISTVITLYFLSSFIDFIKYDPSLFGFYIAVFTGPIIVTLVLFLIKTKPLWLLFLLNLLNVGIVFVFIQFVFVG